MVAHCKQTLAFRTMEHQALQCILSDDSETIEYSQHHDRHNANDYDAQAPTQRTHHTPTPPMWPHHYIVGIQVAPIETLLHRC